MEMKEEELIIKKVLVKCPPLLDDTFSTFPFLIALSEVFPKAEITVICEENCALAYQFLPFKMRIFERPKEKLSLIETHHFCANHHDIFNIDLFFDLENTFNSSFMGFNFRSRERVGYGVGWNKYFLTKNFLNPDNANSPTLEAKCVKLLELYTEKPIQNSKVCRERVDGQKVEKIEKLFQDPEAPKFILVMLDNFKNVSSQISMWTSFFDSFQNQKFIIWSLFDEDLIWELFPDLDLGENSIYIHRGSNIKELTYVLNKVQGVVTNNIWSEGLCTYFGVNSITFLSNETPELPTYRYFYFKPQRVFMPAQAPMKYSFVGEEREFLEMNEVVDHIHFNFKL